MRSTHVRRVFFSLAVGCLALGAALGANIALLRHANGAHDRVGQLQLRLDKHSAVQASAPVAPAIVVTNPPLPRVDDETGPDD
jgi:hypothetical protein